MTIKFSQNKNKQRKSGNNVFSQFCILLRFLQIERPFINDSAAGANINKLTCASIFREEEKEEEEEEEGEVFFGSRTQGFLARCRRGQR